MLPQVFPIAPLEDYRLLDSGGGQKLERFGGRVLVRPDPQTLWHPRLAQELWDLADYRFVRESDRGGHWLDRQGRRIPKELSWTCKDGAARFIIRPTNFKHVGLFPEQATNWRRVAEFAGGFSGGKPSLLNLFGYTGAASILACQAGYEVTHVDASRQALNWVSDNAQASGLGDRPMRLLLEDALSFVQREARRGSRYNVVLLDPPHYGRGPKGQKWQLETGLAPLLESAMSLLEDRALLILSTYAVGYSPLAFANLMGQYGDGTVSAGELALQEHESERLLPAGFCTHYLTLPAS
ncbi:MAG: SAM-dependent methyltransferase [bacterium]|nr:SAM-dependent methyltransferase [bacterium]